MSFFRHAAFAAAIFVTSLTAAEPVALTGTATYRERIALEPGAILEVELLDVSRADAPAARHASIRLAAETQVPIRFTLYYDPALIDQTHTYSVSAKLLSADRVIFRSNTINPVLTRGAAENPEVLMVRADGATTTTYPIVGPVWVAQEILGQGVLDDPQPHITFTSEGRTHGSGGCNTFNGSYAADAQALGFGNLATTLMACAPPILSQETRFHEALRQARTYKIEDGLLLLLNTDGATVLRFRRR